MKNLLNTPMLVAIALTITTLLGCSSTSEMQKSSSSVKSNYPWLNLDTVKAGKYDTGTMWTFDFPPKVHFAQTYNFVPSDDWFNHVRLSALKFATYCSASFVSGDGLVMTNNHCSRENILKVQKEGEELNETGFWAETLEDERKVPGLFVDQLVLIKDVTAEIQAAIDKGSTEEEKVKNEDDMIAEIQSRESDSTGLKVKVTKLFHGGKYSLYGYKTYRDVRLVFTPEHQLGYFGGDPDNFTYPRYNLDCTFYRVYDEEGKPLKTDHYFKWSSNGATLGEPVFVVGNPGTTNRLLTVSQLEFLRDIQYPRTVDMLKGLERSYYGMVEKYPEKKEKFMNRALGFSNSRKAIGGMVDGLRNPILMQKKKDFEKKFKQTVQENPKLNSKYGNLWDNMSQVRNDSRLIANELYVLSLNPLRTAEYFYIAQDLVNLAQQMQLPIEQRKSEYQSEAIDSAIASIFPEDLNVDLSKELLLIQINMSYNYLGENYPLLKKITNGKQGQDAVDYMLTNSSVTSAEKVNELAKLGPEAILNSNDPFIYFIVNSKERREELSQKTSKLNEMEEAYSQDLGRALFEVYGTSIPPDATFTLRISDGVVKGYDYNATEAPVFTTFYGMYDRYYAFDKKYPWSLPERWQNPPSDFDLETPFNFITTNDIIGGNSGSPIINREAEIVGLAFDGNIESLPGNFIYAPEKNRCVGVHSSGMIEAIKDMYKATRLSDELLNGKMILIEESAEKAAQ
jgi:hypothetical protein